MNTLRIKGREGRFEVVGADYGNYLEGYFIGPTKNHVAPLDGPTGPVLHQYHTRKFVITLGPNAREDEVVVLSWGTAHQKKFLDDLPGEQVFSMSLQRYKQGEFVWYAPQVKMLSVT